MGPRLMDQSLQILLRNKGSDIKRSPLGGLKRMETWSLCFMQTLKKSARISKLDGKAANAPRPTQLQRKALTCSCSVEELWRKLRKGSYLEEKFHTTQSDRDAAKKKQMKEYADKRRNARESLIVVGDQVLLNQSKPDVLTPAFDPDPSQQ